MFAFDFNTYFYTINFKITRHDVNYVMFSLRLGQVFDQLRGMRAAVAESGRRRDTEALIPRATFNVHYTCNNPNT